MQAWGIQTYTHPNAAIDFMDGNEEIHVIHSGFAFYLQFTTVSTAATGPAKFEPGNNKGSSQEKGFMVLSTSSYP